MLRSSIAKKLLLALFLAVFVFVLTPHIGLAQQAKSAAELTNLAAAQGTGLSTTPLLTIIINVIRFLLGLLGLLLVVLILYAGFLWMSSQGEEEKINKAKKIITNAIIGLAIILLAFAIVSWVLALFNGGFGGNGGNGGGGRPGGNYLAGIGGGPIESVYPARNQTDVPINTMIAVTFKQNIDPNTICATSNGICNGGTMKNVSICLADKSTGKCCIGTETTGNCANSAGLVEANYVSTTVSQRSGDNKTFVFTPNQYLGRLNVPDLVFKVTLEQGINKGDGSNSSIFFGFGNSYDWQFTTNGQLDLDPPAVLSLNSDINRGLASVSGVYPDPDNYMDDYSVSAAPTATTFNFTASSTNASGYQAASVSKVTKNGGTVDATISGTYTGTLSGNVTVFASSSVGTLDVTWPNGSKDSLTIPTGSQSISLGTKGIVMNFNGAPSPGSSWNFTVTAKSDGDIFTVNKDGTVLKSYIIGKDITKGASGSETLINSLDKILSDYKTIFSSCKTGGNTCLQTQETGVNSGSYDFSINGASAGSFVDSISRSAGQNAVDTAKVNDRPDGYRNTVVQINFNKAINPLDIDQFIVNFGKANSAAPINTSAGYIAKISNGYRTIELTGNIECGRNACGDPIYCWPTNDVASDVNNKDYLSNKGTKYQVEVKAADLAAYNASTCGTWGGTDQSGKCAKSVTANVYYPTSTPCVASASWCTGWNGSCNASSRCFKTIQTTAYYPASDASAKGVTDMANNSLNGSFNYYQDQGKTLGIANGVSGAKSIYSLNDNTPLYNPSDPTNSGYGDNFAWSFWLSDKIDLQSPLLTDISPQGDVQTSSTKDQVKIDFSKVMRSGTIKPGWNYGEDSDKRGRNKRFLAINVSQNEVPVAYWIGNYAVDSDHDGFANYTQGYFDHEVFLSANAYLPLAGSGLESITQNCFLPGAGPKDATNQPKGCAYVNDQSTSTSGCVSDDSLGNAKVALPNPVSYAHMNCSEVDGAIEVKDYTSNTSNACKATYYGDGKNGDYDESGSWIITKDHPTSTPVVLGNGVNLTEYRTGCCLGIWRSSVNSNKCSAISGAAVCTTDQNCKDKDYPAVNRPGRWLLSSDHDTVPTTSTDGRTGCCYGQCITSSTSAN